MTGFTDSRIKAGLRPDELSEYMDWAFTALFRDQPAWRSAEAAAHLDVPTRAVVVTFVNLRDHGLLEGRRLRGEQLMTWERTRHGEQYLAFRGQGLSRRDALSQADAAGSHT